MANKKSEISTKSKAAPAATPLEEDQKTSAPESQVPIELVKSAASEKVEKGEKTQASKKGGKEQQMPVKEPIQDQLKVPTEVQKAGSLDATVASSTTVKDTVKDEDVKNEKKKESKVKKQAAVKPLTAEVVATETAPVSKKSAPEQTSEKATKMKRLTLDIAKPLHKAIKAKAVEEGVPMVDMLRSLLEKHYGK